MRAASILVVAVLMATGCAARTVRIADLKDSPTRYDDRDVRISGVVTSSFGTSLLPVQVYNVDDGTGELTVVARSGRTPARGTRVDVRGQVSEVAVVGGRSIGLHLREEDRRVSRD
ncbi:MAG: hypothetical protein AB7G23_17845 [Vicinamibacterales bacterium]